MNKNQIKDHIQKILEKKWEKTNEDTLSKIDSISNETYSMSKATCISVDMVGFKKQLIFYKRQEMINVLQAFISTIIKIGKESNHFIFSDTNGDEVILTFSTSSNKDYEEIYKIAIELNYVMNIMMPKLLKEHSYNAEFKVGIGIWTSNDNSLVRYSDENSSDDSFISMLGDAINLSTKICSIANREDVSQILMNQKFYENLNKDIEGYSSIKRENSMRENEQDIYGTSYYNGEIN